MLAFPGESLLEQVGRLVDAQKVDLVWRFFVGVPGRDHHGVDFELVVEEIEDLLDCPRGVGAEEGGVSGYPETLFLSQP